MADQVYGRQKLLEAQYNSYSHWREFCLSHGVDVDFHYGNQCWDVCCLLWIQYGLWLYTGPRGYAWECYGISRDRNAVFPFQKVERKIDIKKGDCLVFYASGLNYTGHICFADEDYNGTDIISCLGQNQGQGTRHETPSNIANNNLRSFMGGFRNTKWEDEPPPLPQPKSTKKFPWVLYDDKFRTVRSI